MRRIGAMGTAAALALSLGLGLAAEGSAQGKVKLRIGTHVSIAAHTIMQKRPDLLRNHGKSYEVEWIRFAGGGDAMPALAAGKVDGCLLTPHPFANAVQKARLPLVIVHQLLSFGKDGHYDDATIVRADAGITRVEDLRGKIVGVNAIGGTSDIGIRIMLRKHGLDPEKDVTVVEGRPPHLPAMVRDGKVHAATVFQPFFEEAFAKGDLKVLFRASDIYGGGTDYVFQVFNAEFARANAQSVRDYVADYLAAVNWGLDNRAEAVKLYAETWKLPVPVVDGYLLTRKDYQVRRDGKVEPRDIQIVLDELARHGFIAEPLQVAKFVDPSFLPGR
jgi:sulfonate transport system substrate-binding protein